MGTIQLKKAIATLEREGFDVQVIEGAVTEADHPRNLDTADDNCLVFYIGDDEKQVKHLNNCILLCSRQFPGVNPGITQVIIDEPKLAFYILAQAFAPPRPVQGIHPTSIIHPDAEIHPTAHIGPFCQIEECKIGENTIIQSNIKVFAKTEIGRDVVVEANTCIGAFGLGWAWGKDGKMWVMPQFGGTIIGDDCFIGTNVTIARGSLQDTIIENGCKIAHGTKIGHNCHIGEMTHIANGTAIAGSTNIGKRCFIGTGACFRPAVTIGNDVVVGVGAAVIGTFEEDDIILTGVPATARKRDGRILAGLPKPRKTGE